jgi:dUTP pyrophosphatase
MTQLKIFKTNPQVVLPTFGTQQAACFDIAFQAYGKYEYAGFSGFNAPFTRSLKDGKIVLMTGDRVMVPTGLIFDIPEGYSLRIHPRSGLSYKQGLVLANMEAVIDSDYFHETFVLLTNYSQNHITINNGDRIAQAELVQQLKYGIVETSEAPAQKTDRIGGLGSTGTITVDGIGPVTATIHGSEEPVKRGRGRPKKVDTA